MKVGDLVKFNNPSSFIKMFGIVTRIDDSHRQTRADVLFCSSRLIKNVWEAHIEVISESR